MTPSAQRRAGPTARTKAATAKQPAAKTKQPAAKTKQPAAKTKQPAAKTKQPAAAVRTKAATAKQPAAKVKQPAAKGAQPSSTEPGLATYRKKRDPTRTPEPMGRTPKSGRSSKQAGPVFVIQEHHATALHWDFRLERDGVLVSWAVPKGIPLDPGHNRLAVHTEDHPLDYGTFEGEIPKGEYGGGTVILWDHGHYECEKWTDREVIVQLHGSRVGGRYVLFKTGGRNWMMHRMDPPPAGWEAMPEEIE
ncbi:MAG TPA: DNA polymerase ligase N-terminal domain-containing protein, partial [Acidimicrobiales bacterium]|nr:DNA polymerase ligase N-terminal domain-containing protein [Acidimicrobiales bacterium]